MVQTLNFINLSSQQAPNDVNWAGLVNSGVQGVLIRLGHGIIRDPCASGHIAKAKQYGLYWHGYHTYEGVVNEPQFTIKNATELGLSTSQYYFADLTNSSDPFNDYYALHANWLSEGYSTGLLISNEDYLSKFTDSEVTASGSLRWLISDTEPANYDIWQYSSEGTIGTSSVKIGFNFAKTDKLKYNLSTTLTGADINKDPYDPQTPVGGAYIGWGYDTTGLGGGKTIGYSTNGKNFYALIGPNGLVVRKSDGNRIYGTIADQIDSAISANVIPAKSAADSAVAYANDAIEKSKVNSQAIDDINSAVSDAKQGANDALSRAMSAWDAARSNVNLIDSNYASASASISSARTEALAAADEAKKSASAAQADIVVVKSSVAAVQADITATKSDVAVAKSDIADTKTSLTIQANSLSSYAAQASAEYASTASALSDAKTEFSSDVAEAKSLANTAQTTADNAVKSASSVANDLTAVASQAKANANGITKVTSDVGLLQTTVANNTGDISTIQETAKQIQQAVSDNAGNITVAKQTADSAVAVASDAKSNATVAVQTASQASVTANNASGQAASAVITANGAMTTASDAKSNATVAVQTASGASLTATNANSDATVAKQTASEAKVQASNAESDFAQLSIRANKIETNVANNSGAIASVQQTANGLITTVSNVDNRVKTIENNTNWTTKTGPLDMNTLTTTQNIYYRDTNLKNADGEAGWAYIQVVSTGERVTQTVWHDRSSIQHTRTGAASGSSYNWDAWNMVATNAQVVQIKNTVDGIATTINDPKTGLNATYQTAAGNSTTISNIQGDVSQLKMSASSASVALSDAAGNISSLQATASELETKYADAAGDISQIKTNAKGMTQTISDAQGDIAKLKTRADGFDTQFANINGDINKIQTNATGVTQTLTNAKSDIAVLQSRADGLDAKYATAAGDINTLKADANGFSQTLTNAQGDISTLKSTVSGVQTTLTDAQGNISTLQSDVSGLKKTTSDNAGNISTLQATANTLTSQMSGAQGDISTLKQTATSLNSKYVGMSGDLNNLKSQAQWVTVTDTVDLNNIKTPCHEFLKGTVTNAPNETAWWYLTVEGSEGNRITQTVIADQSNNRYTRRFADNWSAWVRDATQTDVTALSGQITANTTQITQNKQAIALKADQTTVDNTNGTVQKLQSQLQVQAGQIATKVSSSDLDAKGYATQTYTQTQIKQTSDTWNANLTKLQNDTKTALTNLSIGVEGVQAQVYNSDGSSKIDQLSNMIATKVSQGDYNSQITQLKNDINLRVTKGDLISQINLQAGTALIQSNKLVLDGKTTIITGEAFIPSAAISNIQADQVQIGDSRLFSDDGTLNLINQNAGTASIKLTTGNVQGSTQPVTKFANGHNTSAIDISPVGTVVRPTLFFEDYPGQAKDTGWLGFSRHETAELYFHTYDDTKELFRVACVSRFNQELHVDRPIWQQGLSIASGNTIWSGSDYLAIGDHLCNSYTNVMARAFSSQSTLSSKTNIEMVDPKDALDLINRTDIRSYQYKADVEQGKAKRYTSLIIDDVHDVSQYYAPNEFTNEERTGRDDGSAVGYLFLAIQELTRQIKNLEEKLNG
ncbi:tail fiber domain-containing protein [Limosilactobacillus fermentum]|uniref:tail fiber domain-containing protein n=1 Tax=Limosilactobacillus fermentum TaxID=1613 RepID=UPI002D76E929|nr:hypothetical protein [Limosilactobacillus fermentum]WRQ24471.1 hypothetical protein U5A78_10690 [Limosilactobacillus fermentum]